ncbi:radial spoke head 10 homolog B2 isoform X2 [Coturnix japonica]|uniref:Radial spoke head 10 homolog B n=1 Tax=Coturnix japonica TaxID=93934 RepID=A0A8C2TNI2_COTJA|nr:radial spoke head 10 homolog B2 isoform X2 [Coturnix japonica]
MAKDKKKNGKKSEKSAHPVPAHSDTAESEPTKPTGPQDSANGVEETEAGESVSEEVSDKEPEKAEEPPVQDVFSCYEDPILTQLVVERYEGDKVNRLYEGEGVAFFEGGNIYKGMFSEGFMHGQGTYTWADGVKYEGTFVKNMQMVNGRYTWKDGSVYEGSIENGLRHGFGFFRSGIHPVSYIGYWYKGKRCGKGTIYYDQEHMSWYSGDWVDNVKEGWGIRRYKSGNIYEGHWEKNVRHGMGRMRWLTANQEYVGQWVYGIQHGYGTHIWVLKRTPVSQYPLRNKYRGDFVNGERHGWGTFYYASGAVYDGQWVHNRKHGKGKFVFKNGNIYEGEFSDDKMVEYPACQLDAVSAARLDATCSGSSFGSETMRIINNSENPSALGSDIELDISSLLDLLPSEERQEEVKQVEFAVLRHITKLRRVYTFYSSLGCDDSPDNTFLMTRLQFWRFLKDCCFHHSSVTLAEMDRILSGDKTPLEEIHSPYETLLFKTFLSRLIHLSFHVYHEEHKDKGPYLQKCFTAMMSRNVIPTACHVQGSLFSECHHAVFAMRYIDKCWEIYQAFCHQNTRPPFEPTMKMRQFLWMLNDFKLLGKQLTASRLVEILFKEGPSLHDSRSTNLEQELVLLEFLEALLHCALVYVTSDMMKEQVDRDNEKSNLRMESFSEGTANVPFYTQSFLSQVLKLCEDRGETLQEFQIDSIPSSHTTRGSIEDIQPLPSWDTEEEQDFSPASEWINELEAQTGKDEEFDWWMYQVEIFFTNKLFPAYEHEKALKAKIKENQIRNAELAELRRRKDEEMAKLLAEREAEDAKKQKEAAEGKASLESKSIIFEELEEPGAQLAPPPKEEASTVPPPVVTKVLTGNKRRKK